MRSVVRLALLCEVSGRRWLRRVFGSFSLPASHGQPAGRAQRLNEGPPEDACAGTRPTPPHHHTMEAAREPRASGQLADWGRGRRRRRRSRKPRGETASSRGGAASSRVEAKLSSHDDWSRRGGSEQRGAQPRGGRGGGARQRGAGGAAGPRGAAAAKRGRKRKEKREKRLATSGSQIPRQQKYGKNQGPLSSSGGGPRTLRCRSWAKLFSVVYSGKRIKNSYPFMILEAESMVLIIKKGLEKKLRKKVYSSQFCNNKTMAERMGLQLYMKV